MIYHVPTKPVHCSAQERIPRGLPAEALNLQPQAPCRRYVRACSPSLPFEGDYALLEYEMSSVDPDDLLKSIDNQKLALQSLDDH